MCGLNHRNPASIRDTACVTYRCFLPDLTRFVTVCCAATGPVTQATHHGILGPILLFFKLK